jgi:NitT/TauT family transport system ATP-binding protein
MADAMKAKTTTGGGQATVSTEQAADDAARDATAGGSGRLVVENVRIEYRHPVTRLPFCAVEEASLSVSSGEIVSIVGPSGCGKSTLLGAIGGLVPFTRGTISLDGQPVSTAGTDRAVVFQKPALLPWRTALNNVAYPLRLQGVKRPAAARRARAALDRVGLGGFADHYPDQLSGGMQQRVNLARALVVEPELLLLDEPFASVDAQMRQILQDQILGLLDLGTLSAVFVTHQIDEAVLIGDTVVVMSRGPASRIRAVIDVPLSRPRSPEVRRSPEFQALVDQVWGIVKEEIADEFIQSRADQAD